MVLNVGEPTVISFKRKTELALFLNYVIILFYVLILSIILEFC
jgi:hypothetical protein